MSSRFRSFLVVTALLPLTSCDKVTPPTVSLPAPVVPMTAETEKQLAEARDALLRQALEIETKTALMGKQFADMEKALKERENTELRTSLDALKKQNEDLRVQADTARRQSNVITQRIATNAPRVSLPPQTAAPRDYSVFYQHLAPYGHWMDVSGYGYCWSPTISTARWRPYVDGNWAWSSMGWTWQSNEPFGWATYHYGRWINLSRHGWVWVPGCEWSPGWVSWRQSREYVGWAPLPPEIGACRDVYRDCDSRYNLGPSSYTFITTNHFVRPSYTTVCAPVTYNTTIFQNSVNVTQIVRQDCHHHDLGIGSSPVFVHHGGPPRAQMEQVCAQAVPQVQVNAIQASEMTAPRPGHHQHEAVIAPVIVELPPVKADAPPMKPQIADRIEKPVPVSGFEGVPMKAAAAIRETIAEDKTTAAVQQQPVIVTPAAAIVAVQEPERQPKHHRESTETAPVRETVRPAIAVTEQATAQTTLPAAIMPQVAETTPLVVTTETKPTTVPESAPVVVMSADTSNAPDTKVAEKVVSAPVVTPMVVPTGEASKPEAVVPESAPPAPTIVMPAIASTPLEPRIAKGSISSPALNPAASVVTPPVEVMKPEAAPAVVAPESAPQAPTVAMPAAAPTLVPDAAPPPVDASVALQAAAEKMAAEQAAAEAQKQALQAAQQRMLAEQAAAEGEKARLEAQAVAMKQELAAQQAAADTERARQQADAAAMQRLQEEAARRAEEQQMRAQQEAAQRAAQEMAQRQQEEAARRAEEQQMRAQQESAQRAAQEMAQRQAEEAARRADEQQMRAQQEAAQRAAQEIAQRQAEEAARRAQEEAQHAAAEAAARAAAEAARNQPQPAPPGQ